MKPIASLLASFCSPGVLWHAPDSHAGKYHHLSPWTFCAANPIRYSDPTGKVIQTQDNTITYQYVNGNDGWGFYNNNRKYDGNDSYMIALTMALQTLQEGSVGEALVETIVDSHKTVTIRDTKSSDKHKNGFLPDGDVLIWNPNKALPSVEVGEDGILGPQMPPTYIVLGHELAHAEDHFSGNNLNRKPYKTINGESISESAEKRAVYIENMLRHEHGLNYRVGVGTPDVEVTFYPNYKTNKNWHFSFIQQKLTILGFKTRRIFNSQAF